MDALEELLDASLLALAALFDAEALAVEADFAPTLDDLEASTLATEETELKLAFASLEAKPTLFRSQS